LGCLGGARCRIHVLWRGHADFAERRTGGGFEHWGDAALSGNPAAGENLAAPAFCFNGGVHVVCLLVVMK
jgi:hypothetical protein